MMKTVIFAAGLACGCALGSAMTEEQRRKVGEPVRRLCGASATQRLAGSVRHVTDNAAERAASKVDDLAEAIQSADGEPGDSSTARQN